MSHLGFGLKEKHILDILAKHGRLLVSYVLYVLYNTQLPLAMGHSPARHAIKSIFFNSEKLYSHNCVS